MVVLVDVVEGVFWYVCENVENEFLVVLVMVNFVLLFVVLIVELVDVEVCVLLVCCFYNDVVCDIFVLGE